MSRRVLESIDHVLDHVRAGENVALRGSILAALMTRLLGGLGPSVSGELPLQVHHRELPPLLAPVVGQRIGILLQNLLNDRVRLQVSPQQRQRFWTVSD